MDHTSAGRHGGDRERKDALLEMALMLDDQGNPVQVKKVDFIVALNTDGTVTFWHERRKTLPEVAALLELMATRLRAGMGELLYAEDDGRAGEGHGS